MDNPYKNENGEWVTADGVPITISDGYKTESGRNVNEADPKEFIVRPNGEKDFGEITAEVEADSKGELRQGKIRLRVGNAHEGLIHAKKHEGNAIDKGYKNIEDAIADVTEKYDLIYRREGGQNPSYTLVKLRDETNTHNMTASMYLDLYPDGEGNYYVIIGAMPKRDRSLKKGAKKERLIYHSPAIDAAAIPSDGAVSAPSGNEAGARRDGLPTSDKSNAFLAPTVSRGQGKVNNEQNTEQAQSRSENQGGFSDGQIFEQAAWHGWDENIDNPGGNGDNSRGSDIVDERTAREIEREKPAVRRQYEGTPGWMKAPNGKDTNLTEEQWLAARTKAFKGEYGDWEFIADAYPKSQARGRNDVQETITSLRHKTLKSIAENVEATFNHRALGHLTASGAVGASQRNGFTAEDHFTAVANVESLFANSIKSNEREDDNHDIAAIEHYSSLFMAQNSPAIVTFTVKVTNNAGRKIYTIELMELKKAEGKVLGTAFKLHKPKKHPQAASAVDVLNIAQLAEKYNSVKIPLDENGEPIFSEIPGKPKDRKIQEKSDTLGTQHEDIRSSKELRSIALDSKDISQGQEKVNENRTPHRHKAALIIRAAFLMGNLRHQKSDFVGAP